jgi:hypothetical protein
LKPSCNRVRASPGAQKWASPGAGVADGSAPHAASSGRSAALHATALCCRGGASNARPCAARFHELSRQQGAVPFRSIGFVEARAARVCQITRLSASAHQITASRAKKKRCSCRVLKST